MDLFGALMRVLYSLLCFLPFFWSSSSCPGSQELSPAVSSPAPSPAHSFGPTSSLVPTASSEPSAEPSSDPTGSPFYEPSYVPVSYPSYVPVSYPSYVPVIYPSYIPLPTGRPTGAPTPCHFESQRLQSTYDGHRLDISYFGKAVAVYNNTIVVSAPQGNNPNGANSGNIYVYHHDPKNGQVTLQHKFFGSDTQQDDRMGAPLAIHGDTIIAGRQATSKRPEAVVYVYARTDNYWTEQAKLTIGQNVRSS